MPGPSIPGVTPNVTLPDNWQNLPTTQLSFNETVGVISANDGASRGAQFRSWYTQAWAQDPSLTPNQAAATWLTGATVGGNLAEAGGVLGGIPQAAATGANNAYNSLNNATGGAVGAASSAWNAATAVPRFLSMLTSGNLWLRIAEAVAGLILLGIGVNALFKGKPLATVTRTAGKLAPLAMA